MEMLKLAAPVGLTAKPTGVSKCAAAGLATGKASDTQSKSAAEKIDGLLLTVCCAITIPLIYCCFALPSSTLLWICVTCPAHSADFTCCRFDDCCCTLYPRVLCYFVTLCFLYFERIAGF